MFKADWVQFFLPSRIHLENGSLSKMGEWVSTLGCQRALIIKTNDLPFNYNEEIKIAHSSLSKYMDGAIIYDDFSDEPTMMRLTQLSILLSDQMLMSSVF